MGIYRRALVVWVAALAVLPSSSARTSPPWTIPRSSFGLIVSRGGGQQHSNNNHNDPEHVAEDDADPNQAPKHPNEASTDETDASPVGVKAHSHHHHHKKGNAVGDPDGDGSDDDTSDDDSDLDDSEWEELEEELEELMQQQQQAATTGDPTTQVQVEVELVEDNEQPQQQLEQQQPVDEDELEDDDDSNSAVASSSRRSGGGVGLRLGQRLQNHRRNKNKKNRGNSNQKQQQQPQLLTPSPHQQLAEAWQSHVYIPPARTAEAWTYLKDRARNLDGASKARLDRRTLYAGLLLEWMPAAAAAAAASSASSSSTSTSSRKYLDAATSQALQAALSLATQPAWRKTMASSRSSSSNNKSSSGGSAATAAGRQQQPANAIRLYDLNEPDRGCTLAMQESIAMALAHSLGAGMVILDDQIMLSIRQDLLRQGFSELEVRPALLIQSLLQMAREGKLTQQQQLQQPRSGPAAATIVSPGGAAISKCMKRDLEQGLDDPFDERATASYQDMEEWEEKWATSTSSKADSENKPEKALPLVIFVRAQASTSLLKSKSVMETLLHECNSEESTNLVVLGRGIDASTVSLPPDPTTPEMGAGATDHHHSSSTDNMMMPGGNMRNGSPGAAPWFGFSPHNQNASGQNDPEGSRRFNIFLARTIDPSTGTVGVLGAIAPPQAGNLFPHMMAMQARERLQQQQQDDDSPIKAELERWAEMLQQQMQTNGGMPLPPPQFFNASLSGPYDEESGSPVPHHQHQQQPPSPEVIQETLQQAMSELLDRLAQMNDSDDDDDEEEDEPLDPASKLSPNLHKAFAQVLRNENLRRGIADNLARAAPALSDPKCQGVMLSIYVPPPPSHTNRGKLPHNNDPNANSNQQQQQQPQQQRPPMGGWFQKILNNQEQDASKDPDPRRSNSRQRRTRTMAAAAAVLAAKKAQDNATNDSSNKLESNKAERNLAKLESISRPIVVPTPADPVRAKSWDAWIARERGAVIFRQNRRVLNDQLEEHLLSLQEHTGTRGAGSSLRQMLSVRDIGDEMDGVLQCAIEIEAAKSQRLAESPQEMHENEMDLDVDVTLSQLLLTEDGLVENTTEQVALGAAAAGQRKSSKPPKPGVQFLHPSSLESALSTVCRISSSPSGGLSLMASAASGGTVAHRTRDEISALAQDKHERALVSQVVSPQDIGVTYDMIGGLSDVKELLRQSITYPLKFPHLYSEGIAREAVKGVLLFGPPGTGKTMLAKAVATEGGASFLSVDASSVENKWLGESEKNAKAVFTLARRLAPCVIFIDEVDSLLSSREGTSDDSAHGTLTSVKTTMMSEWDGLNSGTNGNGEAGSDRVVVIGSTNRPFDLDEAVLRRFPRRILVDLPDLETRREILEVTLAENRLDPSVNLTKIAERLDGYTGSDLKEVCREAVVQISHEQAKLLDQGILGSREDVTQGSLQRLRPVTVEDFDKALSKLKRSVSEKGRELARVWEWNDEYGEIKKEKKNHLPHLANMYL